MAKTNETAAYTTTDFLADNAVLADACATEFVHRFGFSLRTVWNNVTGLDVLKLDDIVQSGEDSLAGAIEKKKGPEALALVYRLLDGCTANSQKLKDAQGK